MKVLVVIPARAGSKGILGKNRKMIAGNPLINYSIELAAKLCSNYHVCVSTDDKEVLNMQKSFSEIDFHKRKEELAGDSSPITDTIIDVIKQSELKLGFNFDAILLLQPTSPLRTIKNIEESVSKLEENLDYNSVISVCAMHDVHPARMYWKEKNILNPIMPQFEQTRRQDIPPAYYRNGCIYLVRRNVFVQQKQIMAKPIYPYVMPTNWLLNIDEPRDLLIAEALIPAWEKGEL